MKTSIIRKVLMALSGLFLIVFLLQHFTINSLSVCSPDAFNEVSHFMGTNAIIQYVMQPILIFGVIFHLAMGMYLEAKNRGARPQKYAYNKPGASASWMSRNMIITGIMVMLFLGLHFYDFWIPEIKIKFIDGDWTGMQDGAFRYWEHTHHKFVDPVRVGLYCAAFIFLALHLLHGFQSAFQSMGWRHPKYTPIIKKLGYAYAIIIPLGFIVIALFHHLTH